jgi:hypothetical protein
MSAHMLQRISAISVGDLCIKVERILIPAHQCPSPHRDCGRHTCGCGQLGTRMLLICLVTFKWN